MTYALISKVSNCFNVEVIPHIRLVLSDAIQWMLERNDDSVHAIVTDPPYGIKEYENEDQSKLRNGKGGVWRIPPSFDGAKRNPLPRFTILTVNERERLTAFFNEFAKQAKRILVPGGHLVIASNPFS